MLPKHREKLRAALSQPPGAPQKLQVVRSDTAFDVLLCSWEPPEISGGGYPVVEFVIQYENRSLITASPDEEEGHEEVLGADGEQGGRGDFLLFDVGIDFDKPGGGVAAFFYG